MASVDLLYETFELYFKKAKAAHKKGDMVLAKRYYLLSAEQMLKVAKENDGELQKAQYKRAKSILRIAESIVVESKKTPTQDLSLEYYSCALYQYWFNRRSRLYLFKFTNQI